MKQGDLRRYFQFALIIFAAGVIYPVIYLRTNYQVTLLEVFNLSQAQLNNFYSMLGLAYVIGYIPSGVLADRISAKWLIDPDCFAGQFNQREIPETPVLVGCPTPLHDFRSVVANMVANFQQQCKCKLGYRRRSICRNIGHRDVFLPGILIVDDVVSGCENTNKLKLWASFDCFPGYGRLVRKNCCSIVDAFDDLVCRGTVINRQ